MNILNPKVEEYLNGYYKPLNDVLSNFRADCEEKHIPIILKDTESFLRLIMAIAKPSRILEIGTAVGYSAACFAESYDGCSVTTIERDEQSYQTAVNNMERLGLADRVNCLSGDAVAVLNALTERKRCGEIQPFDLLFIDAGKSHYSEFLEASYSLLNKGAVIICDNVLMKAKTVSDEYDPCGKHKTNIRRMRAFVDMITSSDKLDTSIYGIGDGISVSILR